MDLAQTLQRRYRFMPNAESASKLLTTNDYLLFHMKQTSHSSPPHMLYCGVESFLPLCLFLLWSYMQYFPVSLFPRHCSSMQWIGINSASGCFFRQRLRTTGDFIFSFGMKLLCDFRDCNGGDWVFYCREGGYGVDSSSNRRCMSRSYSHSIRFIVVCWFLALAGY